jgi:hypothetical protein
MQCRSYDCRSSPEVSTCNWTCASVRRSSRPCRNRRRFPLSRPAVPAWAISSHPRETVTQRRPDTCCHSLEALWTHDRRAETIGSSRRPPPLNLKACTHTCTSTTFCVHCVCQCACVCLCARVHTHVCVCVWVSVRSCPVLNSPLALFHSSLMSPSLNSTLSPASQTLSSQCLLFRF